MRMFGFVYRSEEEQNMKINKLTLMVATLVMLLGIGGYALAQVVEEPVTQEPAAEQPAAQEPVAQEPVAQEPVAQEPVAQEPVAQEAAAQEPVAQEAAAQEPVAQEAAAQEPVAQEPVVQEPVLDAASCDTRFRDEQAELAATGIYPTPVSDDARACEELGFVNLYPVPYFYDTEGFMYTYDPVADRYTSDPDPATGIYHIYDLFTERFYTYDPINRTYL
jgi:hypothetical protein